MTEPVDRFYRKVPFNVADIETANIKFPPQLFRKKETWVLLLISVALFIFYGIVIIILNYCLGSHKGQLDRLISLLSFVPIILFFLFLMKIQNTIDHKLGYKKVGEFKVTSIINLGRAKILILTGWRMFRIDRYSLIFKELRKNQIIQVQKTATGRLLYYI